MRIIAYLTIPLLVVLTHPVFAEPAGKAEPQSTEPAVAELSLRNQLAKVMQPILDLYRSGNRDAAAYAEYLDRMDALYEASDPEDLEFRTTVLATKGSIYQNILKDMDAAMKEYKHLQKDAAGTPMAEKAEELIAGIEMQRALVVGGEFPGFSFTGAGLSFSIFGPPGAVRVSSSYLMSLKRIENITTKSSRLLESASTRTRNGWKSS